MTPTSKRFLGQAGLKNEGEPATFDEGGPAWTPLTDEQRRSRGAGQSMREQDLRDVWLKDQIWYVVRDKDCSHHIDDEEEAVWTLSRTPGEPGWETDSGQPGYGLKYADARELADAANAVARSKPA